MEGINPHMVYVVSPGMATGGPWGKSWVAVEGDVGGEGALVERLDGGSEVLDGVLVAVLGGFLVEVEGLVVGEGGEVVREGVGVAGEVVDERA